MHDEPHSPRGPGARRAAPHRRPPAARPVHRHRRPDARPSDPAPPRRGGRRRGRRRPGDSHPCRRRRGRAVPAERRPARDPAAAPPRITGTVRIDPLSAPVGAELAVPLINVDDAEPDRRRRDDRPPPPLRPADAVRGGLGRHRVRRPKDEGAPGGAGARPRLPRCSTRRRRPATWPCRRTARASPGPSHDGARWTVVDRDRDGAREERRTALPPGLRTPASVRWASSPATRSCSARPIPPPTVSRRPSSVRTGAPRRCPARCGWARRRRPPASSPSRPGSPATAPAGRCATPARAVPRSGRRATTRCWASAPTAGTCSASPTTSRPTGHRPWRSSTPRPASRWSTSSWSAPAPAWSASTRRWPGRTTTPSWPRS